MNCQRKLNEIVLNNLADSIKIIFDDTFCEDSDCNKCPFYIKAQGNIEGEHCSYLCDYLFRIKEML